ncbi:MAG TPA: potassium/proton antiporter, partial [Flavobacteriales bacterium]|nr:potassium/proton antiporter [Flavobacteriales bacterium]
MLWQGFSRSTVGVLTTAIVVGMAVPYFTSLTWKEGLLLGAIISSTDAPAVFTILRSKGVGLRGNLRPLLELESGSNDPMAYLLTTAALQLLSGLDASAGYWSLGLLFVQQMVIGALAGWAMGVLATRLVNRMQLDFDGLYPVLLLALVLLTFSGTQLIGGNGFLAVYLAGIVMGNRNFVHKKSLVQFYDGQAWLVQIIMFLVLGLLVFPKQLVPVMSSGLLISLMLILVARPIAVLLALSPFRMAFAKRLMISWVGLRGAVPIVLATYPMVAGIEGSGLIFNLVFFVVLTSVAIQGTTLPMVAKLLNVQRPMQARSRTSLDVEISPETRGQQVVLHVPMDSVAIGKSLLRLSLPRGSMVTMVQRGGTWISPTGSTVLLGGDRLIAITGRPDA